MKIYTRTGDDGTTSLFSGHRVKKSDSCIEALGSIDECNCFIGLALSFITLEQELEKVKTQLIAIQNALFDLGAHVATPLKESSKEKIKKTRFDAGGTTELETWIDEMHLVLPPLKSFILPGGDPTGSSLHLARSVCRRAERGLVDLFEKEEISQDALKYINRLSDYLFVLARYVNHITHSGEVEWHHHN
jgi:cob(I)alamin adenosyltransferase